MTELRNVIRGVPQGLMFPIHINDTLEGVTTLAYNAKIMKRIKIEEKMLPVIHRVLLCESKLIIHKILSTTNLTVTIMYQIQIHTERYLENMMTKLMRKVNRKEVMNDYIRCKRCQHSIKNKVNIYPLPFLHILHCMRWLANTYHSHLWLASVLHQTQPSPLPKHQFCFPIVSFYSKYYQIIFSNVESRKFVS